MRRARGTDDDVCASGGVVKLFRMPPPAPDLAFKLLGHVLARVRRWRLRNQVPVHVLLNQMLRAASSSSLPAPTRKTVSTAGATKYLSKRERRNRGDGNPNSNRFRFRSGPFCCRECALQQVVGLPADCSAVCGYGKGFFTSPKTGGSPTTMESRLAAIRKRCETASWSWYS